MSCAWASCTEVCLRCCEQHTPGGRELDLCSAYLDIERADFDERLGSAFDLASASTAAGPMVSADPAAARGERDRHGRAGSRASRAREAAGKLELEVEDDAVGLGNSSQRGAGLALKTRQGLGLRDGTAVALELAAKDPVARTYTERAPIPTPRGGVAGAALDGKLHVIGGEGNDGDASGVFDEVEAYDPASDSWQALPPMLEPRHGLAAAELEGRIYLPGGASAQGFGAVGDHTVIVF
jgi:hypothetical protein